jgi:hypothetical protein
VKNFEVGGAVAVIFGGEVNLVLLSLEQSNLVETMILRIHPFRPLRRHLCLITITSCWIPVLNLLILFFALENLASLHKVQVTLPG